MDSRLKEENIGKFYLYESAGANNIFYSTILKVTKATHDQKKIIKEGDIVFEVISMSDSCYSIIEIGQYIIWDFDTWEPNKVKEL